MARTTKKKGEADAAPPPSIDAMLDGLEAVVTDLESGELPLEEALRKFEAGVKLARQGEQILESVEERIEALLADAEGTEPFEAHSEESK